MYNLSNVRRAIEHPVYALREFNRLYHSRLRTRTYNPGGVDVFHEDWDNLILLDGCRYDVYARRSDLPGRLERRTARGTNTPEFVRANFSEKTLSDTVYVTENVWLLRLQEAIGAEVFRIEQVDTDGLDPRPVTEAAIRANREFPDKRLIVHYMHPHSPFTGETAETKLSKYERPDFYGKVQKRALSVPDEWIRDAYAETLDNVLDHVEELLDIFQGLTVVSADHGELLGDRTTPLPMKDWGHHSKLYVPELTTVPWHVFEDGERKDIREGDPSDATTRIESADLDERLEHFGYKT